MMTPDRYAVFGNPIAHSKSPEIHTAFARQTQQHLQYTKQCVPLAEFKLAADAFFADGGRGLNITVPFKQEAFAYADTLTPHAQAAEAVNTLRRNDDGTILGDNTDGQGMVSDITERLHWPLQDKKILILGAGGAVRGILLPVLECLPRQVTIANRTVSKAQQLVEHFASMGRLNALPFSDLEDAQYDVIINGTSASLAGDLPPVPADCFEAHCAVYDMMYGKALTPFLIFAKQAGASQLADGLGMLVGQAAESFYLWRGVKPDIVPVLEKLRASA